ncbi:MAG: NHLP bacteriocin system secretion protein [Acidobacteria bacterium]|nr:MAG: NHLP bacteriocin system secretion protein [Acidobacteriota bacterium]
MADQQLFRKAALDKLASPEQLDQLMQVTSPRGWIALTTMGGILALVLVWSVFGSIPTRVEGQGILIRGGNLLELQASGNGVLLTLNIKLNDHLEAGQIVATVAQPDMVDRVANAFSAYEQQKREYEAARFEDLATISGNRADLERTQAELAKVEEVLVIKRKSFENGLTTRSSILSVERDKINLEANVNNLRATMRQMEQRIRSRKLQVDAVQRRWEELRNRGERVSEITSNGSGRVIEMKKTAGDSVSLGEVIAVLEPLSAEMQPILYVASTKGKQIRPGMEAEIAPSNVKKEEFGFMKGVVQTVGDYPVTPEGALSVIANAALVRELLGTSSKIEVRAALIPSSSTESGFEWSSSGGPPFKIESGTPISVSVVVDRKPPYTYILPIVKSTLGLN